MPECYASSEDTAVVRHQHPSEGAGCTRRSLERRRFNDQSATSGKSWTLVIDDWAAQQGHQFTYDSALSLSLQPHKQHDTEYRETKSAAKLSSKQEPRATLSMDDIFGVLLFSICSCKGFMENFNQNNQLDTCLLEAHSVFRIIFVVIQMLLLLWGLQHNRFRYIGSLIVAVLALQFKHGSNDLSATTEILVPS